MNIESLRCGGAPAAAPAAAEPAGIPWFRWEGEGDDEGYRPDDPVMAMLGGGLTLHRYPDLRSCGVCGQEYISAATLDAHKRRDHGRGNE